MSMTVTGSFVTKGVIKNELSVRILKWTVKAHKQGKLNIIHKPTVQEHQAFAYIPEAEFHKDVWVRSGRDVYNRPTIEDKAIARDLGDTENVVLEETNMFHTDSRDLAADREAEEHADLSRIYGESSVSSADPLFRETRSWKNAGQDWPLMDTVHGAMGQLAI